jgi:hypothetical protein
MIKPSKFPPLGAADDPDSMAAQSEPARQYSPGCRSANPVESRLIGRMPGIYQLDTLWVSERLDRLRKRYPMFADILHLLGEVPFEVHAQTLPYKYGDF